MIDYRDRKTGRFMKRPETPVWVATGILIVILCGLLWAVWGNWSAR